MSTPLTRRLYRAICQIISNQSDPSMSADFILHPHPFFYTSTQLDLCFWYYVIVVAYFRISLVLSGIFMTYLALPSYSILLLTTTMTTMNTTITDFIHICHIISMHSQSLLWVLFVNFEGRNAWPLIGWYKIRYDIFTGLNTSSVNCTCFLYFKRSRRM